MSETKLMNRRDIIDMINNTSPMGLASLDFVREKFVQNYNACNGGDMGELQYHRQMIHFNQAVAASEKLLACNRFSLYACFVTAAANGYDLDPAAGVVYLVPKGGNACLWRQAPAHVHRLIRSNQIRHAEQVQLVYRGDTFKASKGRVIQHDQNFASPEFYAAYQEFILPDGLSRFFIYQDADFAYWRSKSDVPNGDNWNYQGTGRPAPGFIKTKVTKHACTEKVWASGTTPVVIEQYQDVEIESDDAPPDAGTYKAIMEDGDLRENGQQSTRRNVPDDAVGDKPAKPVGTTTPRPATIIPPTQEPESESDDF